jgi:acetylglutamate kinase
MAVLPAADVRVLRYRAGVHDLDRFSGQLFVVKLGGELAADVPRLAESVGRALRAFLAAGIKIIVVHGGGAQASELSARLGLETRQVRGQRVTDSATLEVLKMALAGQVSVNVAAAMRLANVPALCTTGVSAGIVEAAKRPPVSDGPASTDLIDMGLVGDVTQVNVALLRKLTEAGLVPIIACLAGDSLGHVYNVNADTVAARIASATGARRLFLVSSVGGVLRDRADPTTRLAMLTPSDARDFIANGTIQGGMIPKVEESLTMLSGAIEGIHIVGINPSSSLLDEAIQPGSRGTVLVPDVMKAPPRTATF